MADMAGDGAFHGGGEVALLMTLHIEIIDTGNAVIRVCTFACRDFSCTKLIYKVSIVDKGACHGDKFKTSREYLIYCLHRVDSTYKDQGEFKGFAKSYSIIKEVRLFKWLIFNHKATK